MPDVAKKGITVKVAAELHAEVSEYIRSHGMTMSEFFGYHIIKPCQSGERCELCGSIIQGHVRSFCGLKVR